MTITGVYTQTLRFRWRALGIGAVSLMLLLFFAMAVYRGLDPALYANLPEAFRGIIGIPADADTASLAYSAIYNSYGALALGGLGIAAGTAIIAGDERRGLLSVLLANPRGRTGVYWTKAAAVGSLLVVVMLALWAAAVVTPVILDVNVQGLYLGSFILHLLANTVFFTSLALAVGAWSGRTTLAAGIASGTLVVSFFAVGLLPLVSGAEELVRAFPWYYFAGSDPLLNGIDIADLSVLLGGSVLLLVVGWWGFVRRDLRASATDGFITRWRARVTDNALGQRLVGKPRVSHLWVMALSRRRGLLMLLVLMMVFLMGALMGPIYASLDSVLADFSAGLSPALLALFGGGDLSSPEGFFQVESLGMVAPIAVMVATIVIGSAAVAGEESSRTIGLLLSNPLSRPKLLLQNSFAMVVAGVIVGFATMIGIMLANVITGLGMSYPNIAATSLLLTLLGMVFGSVAVLIGAATGSVRMAAAAAAGLVVVLHVVNAMAVIADASWGWISPFSFYLGGDPMINGLPVLDAVVLLVWAAALIAISVPVYQRRDLRV